MIAKGMQHEEKSTPRTKYQGVAQVKVVGVNMTKEEESKLYGFDVDREINYLSKNEQNIDRVQVKFYLKATEVEDAIFTVSFYLEAAARYNKDNTKVQVLDKYGRSAWVLVDDFKQKKLTPYANGNEPRIDKESMRPALIGEEDLITFIKMYVNIPSVETYKDGKWEEKKDPMERSLCECRLDTVKDILKGNFKELKDICNINPEQKIKVCVGIKTTETGQYMNVLTGDKAFYMNPYRQDYTKAKETFLSLQEMGRYGTTEIDFVDLCVYQPNTEVSPKEATPVATTNPFGDKDDLPFLLI